MQRTESPKAVVVQPVDVRYAPSAKPVLRQTRLWMERLHEQDEWFKANEAAVLRDAQANTLRLTGKPTL